MKPVKEAERADTQQERRAFVTAHGRGTTTARPRKKQNSNREQKPPKEPKNANRKKERRTKKTLQIGGAKPQDDSGSALLLEGEARQSR